MFCRDSKQPSHTVTELAHRNLAWHAIVVGTDPHCLGRCPGRPRWHNRPRREDMTALRAAAVRRQVRACFPDGHHRLT
eukprot:3859661-Prymnesium_polylepis.1